MRRIHPFLTTLRRCMALCMVMMFIIGTHSVSAQQQEPFDGGITEQDLKDILNTTPWYGPSIDGCAIDGGGNKAKFTGDNVRDAFFYFLDPPLNPEDRLTPVASAGIIGNLIQESGVNPRSNQANGPGMGIAQWSEGGRWEQLKAWVATNNRGDIYSLSAQLDFLWYEMKNVSPWNQALPLLKDVKSGTVISDADVYIPLRSLLGVSGSGPFTIQDSDQAVAAAVVIFERKFEKAGIPVLTNRFNNAKNVLKQFGAQTTPTPGTITPPEASEAACEEGGEGGSSNVNAQGYAWPVDDKKKHSYGTAPCKARACHHDGTPAFDLMYGPDGNMNGKAVYAITSGTIYAREIYNGVKDCFEIQFKSDLTNGKPNGNYYYWYGHLQNPRVKAGDRVTAGQQIAEVASISFSSTCRGGRDHLHIDRGCIRGGLPQPGGYISCRDPAFVPLINKLWEELPE